MPGFWEKDELIDQLRPKGRGFWEGDRIIEAPRAAPSVRDLSDADLLASLGRGSIPQPTTALSQVSDADLLASIRDAAKPARAFDQADFERFTASSPASAPNGFNPAEYAAFKDASAKTGGGNPFDQFDNAAPSSSGGNPMKALEPFFAKGVSTRNSAGQFTDEARAVLTREGINPASVDQKTERELLAAYQGQRLPPADSAAYAHNLSVVDSVPVVGPLVTAGMNKAVAFTRSVQRGIPYSEALRQVEAEVTNTMKAHPTASAVGGVVGSIAGTAPLVAAAPAAFGAGAGNLALRAGTAALTGATMSAADAAVREEDIADAAKTGATLGFAGPLAGAAIGRAASGVANRLRPVEVPTTTDLKAAAQAAYKQADDAGVQISADAYERGFQDLSGAVRQAGFNSKLYPKAAAVLEELERAVGTSPSLRDVELLRRVANGAAKSNEAAERRIGDIIIDKLDDFTGRLKPSDVIAGDADAAVASLNDARDLWARYSRARTLETGMDKAERGAAAASGGAAGNTANATRQTIRRILDDPRKITAYSADEIAEMEAIVWGGSAQKALRLIGRLAPQNGGLQALGSVAATVHDPMLAAVPIAGSVAKVLADRNTNAAIQRLGQNVRNGSAVLPSPTAIAAGEGAEDLTRYLLAPAPASASR